MALLLIHSQQKTWTIPVTIIGKPSHELTPCSVSKYIWNTKKNTGKSIVGTAVCQKAPVGNVEQQNNQAQPECECIYFRQITRAHVTINIFHLGDSPASVHGNYRNAFQVYLYGTM